MACRSPLSARMMVVVGGATVVDVVEVVLGAVVEGGGGPVEEEVVAAGVDLAIAAGSVELDGVVAGCVGVGLLVLEPLAEGAAVGSTLEPRLAAQAHPAVAPAPTRPANMARNRRRGRSGGLIGHISSRRSSERPTTGVGG